MKKLMLCAAALMIGAIGFAQNNDATIVQYGTNLAIVEQIGNDNVADVNQGTSLVHTTNVPLVGYYGAGSYVLQHGSFNNALVAVTGSNVGSRINQDGEYNDAKQFLGASTSYRGQALSGYDGRMSIEIIQIGISNEAYQKTTSSFGSYGIGKMWVDQTGYDNYGSQHSKGGKASVMTIKQVGDNNGNAVGADVSSTGLANPLALFSGSNEFYTQYQWGMNSKATIDILGDNNKTTQAQQYTVWNNDAGTDTATIGIIGDGNAVVQGQLGEFNESYVDILGDNNVVATSQDGDSNLATVSVLGDNNIAAVMQTGDLHVGHITQTGNGNTGTIIQHN